MKTNKPQEEKIEITTPPIHSHDGKLCDRAICPYGFVGIKKREQPQGEKCEHKGGSGIHSGRGYCLECDEQGDWEGKFEEKYGEDVDRILLNYDTDGYDDVKDFIRQTIQSEREQSRAKFFKEIEGIVPAERTKSDYVRNHSLNNHPNNTLLNASRNGFNECREEILNNLKKLI